MQTYMTEIYCENINCNARQSRVYTKDHGDNPEPTVWHCPACGKPAKVHWRRTGLEHQFEENRLAVGLVNVQLYVRDTAKPGEPAPFPMGLILLKDPPASWKWQWPS